MTETEFDLGPFLRIEERITRDEHHAIRQRWDYGCELLAERERNGGKQLPNDLLDALCEASGKSRTELWRRAKFAERYSTEDEVLHVCSTYGSWHEIVKEGLRDRHRAPVAQATGDVDGTYRVIYADPPWQYSTSIDKYGPADRHYATMPTEELCELEVDGRHVSQLAASQAVLFMWATSPKLPDGLTLIEAWGFEYKASFIWDKVRHNYGHYNSVRHELLLLGTKGSCTPDSAKLHDSVVSLERQGHSEKPALFRELIDGLYTAGSRLELFFRGDPVPGWDTWGAAV